LAFLVQRHITPAGVDLKEIHFAAPAFCRIAGGADLCPSSLILIAAIDVTQLCGTGQRVILLGNTAPVSFRRT